MHKLMSMPAINEDETSSGEDEQPAEMKRKPKKKISKSINRPNSVKRTDNKHHFIEEGDEEEEEEEKEKHELIRTQSKGVKHFFRDLFSCTKKEKYEKTHSRLN